MIFHSQGHILHITFTHNSGLSLLGLTSDFQICTLTCEVLRDDIISRHCAYITSSLSSTTQIDNVSTSIFTIVLDQERHSLDIYKFGVTLMTSSRTLRIDLSSTHLKGFSLQSKGVFNYIDMHEQLT